MIIVEPTPGVRAMGSTRLMDVKLERKVSSKVLSGEYTEMARRMSGDFFFTEIPAATASFGNLAVALLTRLLMSTFAMSRLEPTLNVQVSTYRPSLEDLEDM